MPDLQKIREHIKNGKTFTTIIPSMNVEVYGKPYTLDDEITMSGLYEQKNVSFFFAALINIIADKYSLTPDVLSNLTSLDVEWLTIQLKKNSDSDVLKLSIPCPKCKTKLSVDLDLNKVEIKNPENFTKMYDVSKDVKIEVGLPNYEDFYKLTEEFKDISDDDISMITKKSIEMFKSSIKCIYVGNDVEKITPEYRKTEEFNSFVMEELRKQYLLFQNYISEEAPKIVYDRKIECAKCKKTFTIDVNDFFYSLL
jgi:hypothetical protein